MAKLAALLARSVDRIEENALPLLLALIVLLNAVNVFLRYVVGRSFGPLFELMVLLSLPVYWIGISAAERSTGHLGMTFVVTRLRGPLRTAATAFRALVMIGFLLAVGYSGAQLCISQYQSGTVSGALEMPLWCFSLFIPLGAMLMVVRMIAPKSASERREPV